MKTSKNILKSLWMSNSIILSILITLTVTEHGFCQYADNPLPQYPEEWNALWISHPDIAPTTYNMVHFRKSFDLYIVPETFTVHISGDNRYRLYVNGQEVFYGPQLGDVRHWRYETLNLAPFLNQGKNLIAVEVMNWGADRSYGIVSYRTGLLIQGHGKGEHIINTGPDLGWKVLHNKGMNEKTVHWRTGDIIGGFYAANPTDSIVGSAYPWGWKTREYSDAEWQNPKEVFSKPKTNAGHGHGWILQPRTTAMQKSKNESIGKIVRSGIKSYSPDVFGNGPLTIPANSEKTLLIDKGYVTLGYPKLNLSKGKDAQIRVTYSEALYDENNQKGNRNDIKGKRVEGITDVYIAEGGQNRIYQPIWFRAFRFIELYIKTQDEPLVINDYHNIYSATNFPVIAKFNTQDKIYKDVWDICWRGMKICAQDNLMSDAYYEQMQYVGDLRPHLKGWVSLTGDLSYFRSAIEQFNNSRLPDGNITSCYPLKATFVHPTYSLMWIDMLHDLMLLEGDRKFIGQFKGEIQEVFDYYETLINENGLVGKSKYTMFVDWYMPKAGYSKVNKGGNSAILTLNYAYSLSNAADILDWLGHKEISENYRMQSIQYAETTRKLCYDKNSNRYADDPEKTFYDQRAGILAVLTGAHNDMEKKRLMETLLDAETYFDSEANLFYYFYLFEAMKRTGVGNFKEQLQPWKEIVDMGMTATPEKRIEQNPRSEVHPWTAHPVHYYFNVVAGIHPKSPGFKTVEIRPMPGDINRVDVTYPTVHGNIKMNVKTPLKGRAPGIIKLPEGMTGVFIWKGEKLQLQTGQNKIK